MSEQNAQVAIRPIDKLRMSLSAESVQQQFKSVLADNSSSFIASLIELFANDQKLQECTPGDIILQALKAATLKLPVIKSLGHAFIIAYKGKPEFQLGYKGLIQLAIRTGQYKTLHCGKIYEGELQVTNKLTGEFDFNGKRKSDIVAGFFSHEELKNGFSKTIYMTVPEINDHAKKYSKSYSYAGGPWKTDFDKMALKTVLIALLSRWGLLSVEIQSAIDETSDRVESEISANANTKNADFAEADLVDDRKEENGSSQDGAFVADFSQSQTNGNSAPF